MQVHRERPYIEARRTYRALQRKHSDAILYEQAMRDADHQFDHGEWSDAMEPEPEFHNAYGEVMTRLFLATADAYGLDPCLFDDRLFLLDEDEAHLVSPGCPYEERGLDCRNSAPVGIDADGEPYGSRGCGCDRDALRRKALQRLCAGRQYAPHNMTGDPLMIKLGRPAGFIPCSNTVAWCDAPAH